MESTYNPFDSMETSASDLEYLVQILEYFIKFYRQENQLLLKFIRAPWILQQHRCPICLHGLLIYRIDKSIYHINSEAAFLILKVSHFCLR